MDSDEEFLEWKNIGSTFKGSKQRQQQDQKEVQKLEKIKEKQLKEEKEKQSKYGLKKSAADFFSSSDSDDSETDRK